MNNSDFVNCDCCDSIINMEKDGYYILQKEDDEQVWCNDCYYSESYDEMKEHGWTCDDDSIES